MTTQSAAKAAEQIDSVFMARGVKVTPDDSMAVDQNTAEDNETAIPVDPAAAAIAHGTSVDIPPCTSGVGAQFASNTINQQRLPVGNSPPAPVPRSRNGYSQDNHHEASSTRPQTSLTNDIFSTPEANVQGAHLILRSFLELDPANLLTLMLNQVKTLLDAV